jgi:hypothetical protein
MQSIIVIINNMYIYMYIYIDGQNQHCLHTRMKQLNKQNPNVDVTSFVTDKTNNSVK